MARKEISKERRIDILYIIRRLAIERGFIHNKVSFDEMFESYLLKTGKTFKKGRDKISWLNDIFESGSCEVMNPNSPYKRNPYKRIYKERLKVNYELAQTKDFYNSSQWKSIRLKAISKYGNRCLKCGKKEKGIHVDHILPRSKFPEEALKLRNLQVLCSKCNRSKSNISFVDYREYVAKDGKTAFEQYAYSLNTNDALAVECRELRLLSKGKTLTQFYNECKDPLTLLYIYYKISKEDDRGVIGALAYVTYTILDKLNLIGYLGFIESEKHLESAFRYCNGYITDEEFYGQKEFFSIRTNNRNQCKLEAQLMLCITVVFSNYFFVESLKSYLEERRDHNVHFSQSLKDEQSIIHCYNYIIDNLESMVLYLIKKRLPREMFNFKD